MFNKCYDLKLIYEDNILIYVIKNVLKKKQCKIEAFSDV